MKKPAEHLVVFHKKGPHWPKQGLSLNDPIAQEHAKYFGALYGKGIVIEGGPFPGKAGGMMVFKKNLSIDDVTQYANEDPAIKKGIMAFEVKTWMKVFEKK